MREFAAEFRLLSLQILIAPPKSISRLMSGFAVIQSHSFAHAAFCFVTSVASIVVSISPCQTFAQLPPGFAEAMAEAKKMPTDPAAVVAIVGEHRILLGDFLPRVEARIREVIAKNGAEIPEDQIKLARYSLSRPLLSQAIQTKMMRQSFLGRSSRNRKYGQTGGSR